jgi:TatD DNase family protein
MSYSDSHIHFVDYPDRSIAELLARMRDQDVEFLVNMAVNVDTSEASVALARRHDSVLAAIGVHPWFATSLSADDQERLERLAASGDARFLGEIGLDFSPMDEPPPAPPPGTPVLEGVKMPTIPAAHPTHESQREVLQFELRLAMRYGLPVSLHCRGDAHGEMMELLRRPECAGLKGVAHGFEGGLDELRDWLDLGFLIAVGYHQVVMQSMPALEQVVKAIPVDQLVLETDSNPMMAPETGPLDVIPVAKRVAEIRGAEPEDIGSIATTNLKRLLNL